DRLRSFQYSAHPGGNAGRAKDGVFGDQRTEAVVVAIARGLLQILDQLDVLLRTHVFPLSVGRESPPRRCACHRRIRSGTAFCVRLHTWVGALAGRALDAFEELGW